MKQTKTVSAFNLNLNTLPLLKGGGRSFSQEQVIVVDGTIRENRHRGTSEDGRHFDVFCFPPLLRVLDNAEGVDLDILDTELMGEEHSVPNRCRQLVDIKHPRRGPLGDVGRCCCP